MSNNFRKTAVPKKNMNYKLKLQSKGVYYQFWGAVTVLNFFQTLALGFPYICLQFFPGNVSGQKDIFYRKMYRKFSKLVLAHLAARNALNFFQ